MNNTFLEEPIVRNTSYIGWGNENGIRKIIVKEHQRLSVEEDTFIQYA